MADRSIDVYECVRCECRGPTPERVQHLLICGDRSQLRTLTFVLPAGVSPRPSFGAG
jgi:hypothetical protein